jgi:hypothetical protein
MRTTHQRPVYKRLNDTSVNHDQTCLNVVDAACYEDANQYSSGACLRDVGGWVIEAYMKKFEGKAEVREAKAVALKALTWLQQYNLQQIQMEIDCMQVA